MRNFFTANLICFFLINILLIMPYKSANAETKRPVVKLATLEYPPLISQKIKSEGFLPDLTRHLFQRLGYRVEIQFRPFKRAYLDAKFGKVDGILALWHRPFREEFFVYGPAVHYSQYMIIKRKGTKFQSFEKPFSALHLGVTRGSAPPQKFLDQASKVEISTDEETSLKKLFRGRIDLAYVEKHQLEYLERTTLKSIAGSFEALSQYDLVEPLFIAFSKKGKFSHLAVGLKREFESFIQTSSYDRLLVKYKMKRDYNFPKKTSK